MRRNLVVLATALVLLPASPSAVAASGRLPAPCDGTWKRLAPLPSPGTSGYSYRDIVAIATRDVWVVGGTRAGLRRNSPGAIALHWDGLTWTRVPTPFDAPGDRAVLTGVDAESSSNVWAIGRRFIGGVWYAYVIHWNGSAWRIVRLPTVRAANDGRERITVAGPHDVWAITGDGLTLHRTGAGWRKIRPGKREQRLWDISSATPTSVWAMGAFPQGRPFLERWNGRRWELHASPQVPTSDVSFQGVNDGAINVESDSQLMAVGQSYDAHLEDDIAASLWRHGEASKLRFIPIGRYGIVLNEVADVAWQSRKTAWAVGDWPWTGNYGSNGAYGFIDHWNGKRWTTSWYSKSSHTWFVAVSSAQHVTWALGQARDGSYFIERHC